MNHYQNLVDTETNIDSLFQKLSMSKMKEMDGLLVAPNNFGVSFLCDLTLKKSIDQMLNNVIVSKKKIREARANLRVSIDAVKNDH